jgi:hypothetical protein
MPWAESRILLAERSIEDLYRRLLAAADQLKAVRQGLQASNRQLGGGGTSGASNGYFSAAIAADLAHGSSVDGQEVWTMPGRVTVAASATIHNDGPTSDNDIPAGKQVILAANADGSYTAIGVYC